MTLPEFILSHPATVFTGLLCLFLAQVYLCRSYDEPLRRWPRVLRALNLTIFGFAFFLIVVVDMEVAWRRVFMRTAFWIFLFSEIGYNRPWIARTWRRFWTRAN